MGNRNKMLGSYLSLFLIHRELHEIRNMVRLQSMSKRIPVTTVHPSIKSFKVLWNLLKWLLNLLKPRKQLSSWTWFFCFSLHNIWNHLVTHLRNPWLAEGWKWVTRNLPRNCNHGVCRSFRHRGGTNKAKTDFLSVQVNMPALPFTSIIVCMSHLQPIAFIRDSIVPTASVFQLFPLKKKKKENKMSFSKKNFEFEN